jgi:hypothetical protein
MEKRTVFLTSKKKNLGMSGPEGRANKMEKKKESTLPMWVLLITIGLGVIILVRFVFLSE